MKRKYIACRRVLFEKYPTECLLFSVGYGMMTKNFEYNYLQ